MAELKKTFPPGIDYINIYDPTTFVSQSIHEVIVTIGIAIILQSGARGRSIWINASNENTAPGTGRLRAIGWTSKPRTL
jgi:hypothetical protein